MEEKKSEKSINNIKFNFLIIFCLIIFCFAIAPITMQNDTFYTIKIGEYITHNGIDMMEHFSMHEGFKYTYPHWLYDLFTYFVYSVGGFFGIYISVVVLTFILGLIIYFTNVKISKNHLTSGFITFFTLYMLKGFIAARAQLVTFILFALTIYFIEMFIETQKNKYAIGLVIIPLIIANIHLAVWPFYFILYLPYIAEYLICAIIDLEIPARLKLRPLNKRLKHLRAKGKDDDAERLDAKISRLKDYVISLRIQRNKKRKSAYKVIVEKKDAVKWLILIMLICVITGFCTPLGTTPFTYLYDTMQGNTTEYISEHQPLTLVNNLKFVYLIAVYLMILMLTDSKIKLSDGFMLLGLMTLAFMSRRQTSMVILIGSYILNKLIVYLLNKYDPKGSKEFIKKVVTVFGRAVAVLIVILISITIFKPKMNNEFINTSLYPVEATKWIKENIDMSKMKLYNGYNYGSYLLLNDIPVFIDSRADLYTPEFQGDKDKDVFTDYTKVTQLKEHYEPIFEKYGITHVMLTKDQKLKIFIDRDSNYSIIYEDDNFVIYQRLNANIIE